MQSQYERERELFEFYSNLLESMSPDWIAEQGGGNSSVERRTHEDNHERTILSFEQYDRGGINKHPLIIIDFDARQNVIEDESRLCIYKKYLGTWHSEEYFPWYDDFVQYKPRESFKKWVKYSIRYKSYRLITRAFHSFLHKSKRKEMQRASQFMLGR
jgi:hypothetical protein